ncbi:MAG: NAD(+)/NADH kinase [Treponema sp.]|nr:NAD(+)/NADH kinase [Treponema sp.]
MPKKAILFTNLHKAGAGALAEIIRAKLGEWGIATTPFPFTDKAPAESSALDFQSYHVAISLGGDGTVLYAARMVSPFGTPVFPIHMGTLGFIAAVQPGEWEPTFRQWLDGNSVLSRRLMLHVSVERAGTIIARGTCLNDAVISTSGIAKVIRLHVETGTTDTSHSGNGVIRLGEYRSDGLIIATPTGSTAYSTAAGGPILDPEMEALIVNPICPFSLSNRPLVVPAWETIMVTVDPKQRSNALLTLDGQITEPLEQDDRIHVKQAPYQATLIASDRSVFYRALRTKLSWAGAPHVEASCLKN